MCWSTSYSHTHTYIIPIQSGQKARISLARCVYSQPSVALLDDILSALDAATGKYIFERLFESSNNGSGLLSKSAVVLVTHVAHFLSRVEKYWFLTRVDQSSLGIGTRYSLRNLKTR